MKKEVNSLLEIGKKLGVIIPAGLLLLSAQNVNASTQKVETSVEISVKADLQNNDVFTYIQHYSKQELNDEVPYTDGYGDSHTDGYSDNHSDSYSDVYTDND